MRRFGIVVDFDFFFKVMAYLPLFSPSTNTKSKKRHLGDSVWWTLQTCEGQICKQTAGIFDLR
jgi:hypothetical protein